MPNIVLVQRLGTLKNVSIKENKISKTIATDEWKEMLCKKAGFKTVQGFELHHKYHLSNATSNVVHVYGKINGKANNENKYDFPPPIDNTLFFGNCVLVMVDCDSGEVKELTTDVWEKIYERLFGGFEDLNAGGAGAIVADMMDQQLDELEMTEEERRIMKDPKTKFSRQGYVMDDGFIVDDDEADDDDDADDDEADDDEEEEVEYKPKSSRSQTHKGKKQSSAQCDSKRKGTRENTSTHSAPNNVVCETPLENVVLPNKRGNSSKSKTPSTKDKKPPKTGKPTKSKVPDSTSVEQDNQDHSLEMTEELETEEYLV